MRIDEPTLGRLHDHAVEGYPHEVCGILASSAKTGVVVAVKPLVNERADSPHNRYRVSGLTVMRAEQALEAEGYEIAGYYHSHPDHPADYSETDRDNALPNLDYLITAIHDGAVADTKVWRLRDDRSVMDPVNLEIE
jgi:proteasome lid subunit RPN8/RPN11